MDCPPCQRKQNIPQATCSGLGAPHKILNPYRSRQSPGRCSWCNFDTTPLPPGRAGRDGFVERKPFAGRVVPKKTIADTAEKNSLCQNKSAVCNCTSIASRKRGYLIFISRKRTDYILLRNHQAPARKGRGLMVLGVRNMSSCFSWETGCSRPWRLLQSTYDEEEKCHCNGRKRRCQVLRRQKVPFFD